MIEITPRVLVESYLLFQSDLSDEEIEVTTGVKLPAECIEYIKRKNELRALERHVINIIFNLGGAEVPEDSEEINILLRRRSLRMLMEEKAARTRADPRWSEHRRVALRRTIARSTELRRIAPRRAELKNTKSRHVHRRSYQSQLTQVRSVESVTVEQVKHQLTEFQQVEQEPHSAELQQVTPQWVDCVLLEPPQAASVLLAPVENVQSQFTEIQEVTEVRVVEKIRIYEEIIEG